MKKIIVLILVSLSITYGQIPKLGEAKGLFLSTSVGPRIPLGQFSDTNNPGSGFDVGISYSDNILIPFFLNLSIGYTHFPGRQELYSSSDYSSFSSNMITITFGGRYYGTPLMENVILLMPVFDCSLLMGNFYDYHQYKLGSGKEDHWENYSKFGIQAGAGFSTFLFDIMAYYNYLPGHNYFSFDIRARIPIFVQM